MDSNQRSASERQEDDLIRYWDGISQQFFRFLSKPHNATRKNLAFLFAANKEPREQLSTPHVANSMPGWQLVVQLSNPNPPHVNHSRAKPSHASQTSLAFFLRLAGGLDDSIAFTFTLSAFIAIAILLLPHALLPPRTCVLENRSTSS